MREKSTSHPIEPCLDSLLKGWGDTHPPQFLCSVKEEVCRDPPLILTVTLHCSKVGMLISAGSSHWEHHDAGGLCALFMSQS